MRAGAARRGRPAAGMRAAGVERSGRRVRTAATAVGPAAAAGPAPTATRGARPSVAGQHGIDVLSRPVVRDSSAPSKPSAADPAGRGVDAAGGAGVLVADRGRAVGVRALGSLASSTSTTWTRRCKLLLVEVDQLLEGRGRRVGLQQQRVLGGAQPAGVIPAGARAVDELELGRVGGAHVGHRRLDREAAGLEPGPVVRGRAVEVGARRQQVAGGRGDVGLLGGWTRVTPLDGR